MPNRNPARLRLAAGSVRPYLPRVLAARDTFEVEAFGRRSGAVRIEGAAYDPERRKILM